MQTIVAFQGLGLRDWKSLYQAPAIQEAIHWGQDILASHDIGIESKPLDLVKACQENGLPLQEHSQTCWQQPAIYLASMAFWERWQMVNPTVSPILLGLSFGEWSAATAAGCMDKETGLLTTAMRGQLTSQAGGSALLVTARESTLPIKRLRFRCKRVGNVWLANINSPKQGLIAGRPLELREMEEYIKVHFPDLRTRPYPVGGAFHTPLMKKARDRLAKWLSGKEFREPTLPMLLNATREVTRDPERIRSKLLRQLSARLNFKRLAEELPQDVVSHELSLGGPVIVPLIEQTWAGVPAKKTRLSLA